MLKNKDYSKFFPESFKNDLMLAFSDDKMVIWNSKITKRTKKTKIFRVNYKPHIN